MKIYAVILNWNGYNDTVECIKSLCQVKPISQTLQIIVLDNGSENDEGKKLKAMFPEIHLIQEDKNTGFCAGNNIAIRYCLMQKDCQYILLINNDVVVERDFLIYLIRYLDIHANSVVSPKINCYLRPHIIQTLGGRIFLGGAKNIGKNKKSECFSQISHPDFLSGTCFMARREIVERVGFFNEKYFAYFEDADWCLRARKLGYELTVIPDSIIYHRHSQSTKKTFFKIFLISRNSVYFARKNFYGARKYTFIINSLFLNIIFGIIKYKNPRALKFVLKGFIKGCIL